MITPIYPSTAVIDMEYLMRFIEDTILCRSCQNCNEFDTIFMQYMSPATKAPYILLRCYNPDCNWFYDFHFSEETVARMGNISQRLGP